VRAAIKNESDDFKYNSDSLFYKGRFLFFVLKQIVTCISVTLLLTTLIRNIIN